jgi:hypothetical protein
VNPLIPGPCRRGGTDPRASRGNNLPSRRACPRTPSICCGSGSPGKLGTRRSRRPTPRRRTNRGR